MLFRDSPKTVQVALFKDKEHTCQIDDWTLELLPKKIFRITRPGKHSSVHYDTIGFWQCSFLKALKDWHIPIPPIIEQGKALRDEFPADFDIELYNLTETRLHVELMNRLQAKLEQVGLGDLSGYHGAGAIAARMLDKFNATYYRGPPPFQTNFHKLPDFNSYYGGRIEMLKRGLIENVYNYDINSAYPAATRELPNLHEVKWTQVKGESVLDYDFGVAKVHWKAVEDNRQLGAFPFRLTEIDGRKRRLSIYPTEGTGVYHLVEIKAALARKLWDVDFKGGLVLAGNYEKPFWDPINDIMKQRLAFKAAKDMAHVPLKLGANSFYGKFAQRNKDKHEFGQYANYWYAGYITAWCRAQLLKYMNPDSIILAATDGMYSTEPLACPIGPNLGEWEFEKYSVGKFILPGIYKVDDTVKMRGFPKMDFDNIFTRVLNGEKPKVADKLFVGIRRSLQLHKKYPKCGFYMIEKTIDWNSISDKRVFMDNMYSEPRGISDPKARYRQKESYGFEPWLEIEDSKLSTKAEKLDDPYVEAWENTYEN